MGDKVIERILKEIDNVSYVSFDIYDTLLFRMVRHPARIFDRTYEAAPYLFPAYIDAREWREIRTKAEQFARGKKKGFEISIDDIYDELPQIIENREEIKRLEIECESKNSYLNTELTEFLFSVVDKFKKKVILVSDMYLHKEHMKKILEENGLNLKYVHKIYISSESGYTKRSGRLFDYIIKELACGADKILHIGDSRKSDYLAAKERGMKAYFYPLCSEVFSKYPYTRYEVEKYGYICDEIHTLRLIASRIETAGEDKNKKFWRELGSMIMGPILTFAAEWVLDTAEANGIKRIYPMMREGKFLASLLQQAKIHRNWDGIIQPMYISRRALYPALLSVLKPKDIDYIISTKKMTVGRLFELLDAVKYGESFRKYWNYNLIETKKIYDKDGSVFSRIEACLHDEQVIKEIRDHNRNADEYFFGYLKGLGLDKGPYITFDVGWRGNAQNAIQRIMNKHNVEVKGLHLLINGIKSLISEHNLEDNCEIRGFTGSFGKNESYLNEIIIPIFEMFLMCDEGTTIGYEQRGDEYIPILDNVHYDKYQLEMMSCVQKGIMNFQKKYFELCKIKRAEIRQDPGQLLMLVGRMMNAPTRKEANMIGEMQYDQNFGINESWTIISDQKLEEYKKLGYTEFVYQEKAREDEWYQGMDACLNGLDNYKKICFLKRNGLQYKYALFVERICKSEKTFVLVGAGDRLKDVIAFLNILDETKRIEMVMDSNPFLQEIEVCGQKVFPISTKTKSNCFVITAINKTVVEEISELLKDIHGKDVKIISME
jgi:predicted HAD superfamily hydrolase